MGFFDRFKSRPADAPKVPTTVVSDSGTRSPVWSDWDALTAIKDGYKRNPWVYSCIKLRGDALASAPLMVERQAKDGSWEPVEAKHPLAVLMGRLNYEIDNGEMMRLVVSHLDLAGNAYWQKTRGSDGRILELWPLMPQFLKPIPGRESLNRAYQYMPSNGTYIPEISERDIVHLSYCNPETLHLGQSIVEAIGASVDIDNEAAAWQKVNMNNRGVPDGVFLLKDLTAEQYGQASAAVNKRYSSGSRAPWVMSSGDYKQMAYTPLEADFAETRRHAMRQICAAFGVPVDMLAGQGDANLASSQEVRRSFWSDTIIPLQSQIASGLTMNLCSDYQQRGEKLRIVFDNSSVAALQTNLAEKLANAKMLLELGYTLNEVNQKLELGMDDVKGDGDIRYLPAQLVPMSAYAEPPADPATDGAAAYGEA
jgi:HK97 family phage portal protein